MSKPAYDLSAWLKLNFFKDVRTERGDSMVHRTMGFTEVFSEGLLFILRGHPAHSRNGNEGR